VPAARRIRGSDAAASLKPPELDGGNAGGAGRIRGSDAAASLKQGGHKARPYDPPRAPARVPAGET